MYTVSRFARSRVENYRMFPHVKRNTRNFFFIWRAGRRKGGGRRRERERERVRARGEIRRNANGVLFHPRAPPTLARAIYGLSRYRRNIRTLTTLYIYNGAGCFIGHSIARRVQAGRSRCPARAEQRNELGASFTAKCIRCTHTCCAPRLPTWCTSHHVLPSRTRNERSSRRLIKIEPPQTRFLPRRRADGGTVIPLGTMNDELCELTPRLTTRGDNTSYAITYRGKRARFLYFLLLNNIVRCRNDKLPESRVSRNRKIDRSM